MAFVIFLLVLILVVTYLSYKYFKKIIFDIIDKLAVLDKIFEERYNELSKAICQFQKYLPEQKNLIFDIQKAKADAAKVSRPKTAQELSQKITNENALTINVNFLIDKCDFNTINPELKKCVEKQIEFIRRIEQASTEYNKLITLYNQLKTIFPFTVYTKLIQIDLDLDVIKT